jgi:putative phosphoribosyl transferase
MGSTIRAAIALCRRQHAKKIVVILERPSWFRAVAQAYRKWYDVPDEEVIGILEQSHEAKKSS